MRTLLAVLLILGGAAPVAAIARGAAVQEPMAAPSALEVAEIAIARAVVDREPQESADSFPADVGTLVCWTRITGAEGETQVEHVWYHGDQEVARVPLRIASASWRTWSTKTIPLTATGNWRVDVVGPDGTVLKSASFTVGSAEM
jgi:hypothetical protein